MLIDDQNPVTMQNINEIIGISTNNNANQRQLQKTSRRTNNEKHKLNDPDVKNQNEDRPIKKNKTDVTEGEVHHQQQDASSASSGINQGQPQKKIPLIFYHFDESCRGRPYKIYIQKIETHKHERLEPLDIAKLLIVQDVGNIDRVKDISYNKAYILTSSRQTANKILKLTIWAEKNTKAFIPNHLMVKQGIIKGIPINFNVDDLLNPNNVEFTALTNIMGAPKIISARRFSRKIINKDTNQSNLVPTTTVQITVRGPVLRQRYVS